MRSSNDLIIYSEQPGGDDTPVSAGVFEISTGTEMSIAPGARAGDVDDGTIVFTRVDGASSGLYALDWSTKTESVIAESDVLDDYFMWPTISGRNVVWEGTLTRDGDTRSGLWVANLDTAEIRLIAEQTDWEDYPHNPDIAGDWVVYTQVKVNGSSVQGDIIAYRLSTGARYTLCAERHDQSYPVIADNGIVVWQDQRNAKSVNSDVDVYGCSVYNRTNFAVATGPKYQSRPSAEGNIITYLDENKPGGYGLIGKDLLSGTTFGIAPAELMGTERRYWSGLSGGVIAWNRTRWIDDGSEYGTYKTDMYMAQPTDLGQVAGPDRFSTAVIASQESYPDGAQSAIIASGLTWADALAGAGLAGIDRPLLLTGPASLPSVTATELRRLGVTDVTILGGPMSVSPAVEAQVAAIVAENRAVPSARVTAGSVPVTRLAGKDRIEAATRIASEVASRPGWDGTVIVAASTTFADALAASPVAAKAGLPLVLATPSGLTSPTVAAIQEMGATRAIVVGGAASVPASVDKALTGLLGEGKVTRLSGRDRYATAAAIADFGVADYGLSWNGAGIASGTAFADAMVGGIMKGKSGSVMLLTSGTSLSSATASKLMEHRVVITKGTYIGGTATVTKPVRGQVRTILK